MDDVQKTVLVGSMHTFTCGYGYGVRVPTERNIPGPRAVPTRHYPVNATPRQERSAVLLQHAPNAEDRNLQHIQHLSSGEYGRFLKCNVDNTSSNRRRDSGQNEAACMPLVPSPIATARSEPNKDFGRISNRSGRSEPKGTTRDKETNYDDGTKMQPHEQMTTRTKMKAMLEDLDSSFSRRNKYDLSTAIAGPPKDIGQLRGYGISNYLNFEEGQRWSNSLRRSGITASSSPPLSARGASRSKQKE